jgi:hypothetical protein
MGVGTFSPSCLFESFVLSAKTFDQTIAHFFRESLYIMKDIQNTRMLFLCQLIFCRPVMLD